MMEMSQACQPNFMDMIEDLYQRTQGICSFLGKQGTELRTADWRRQESLQKRCCHLPRDTLH